MRLTLPRPDVPTSTLDVDVDPGLPAGSLRRRLALLTGDARWALPHRPLEVAGHAVDDDHPVGVAPLLPGAHVGPAPPDDARAAAGADLHVAVLSGPAAGRVVAVPVGARAPLPGAGPRRRDGRQVVVEAHRGRRHVRVSVRGGHGTLRRRRVGTVARRWAPGTALQVATTTYELRGTRPTGARRRRVPPWAWGAVASTVGAVVLAAALRQPLLLLTAATGLVGLLAARGHGAPPPAAPPAPDPDPDDVAGTRVRTARALVHRTGPVPGADDLWPADRTLAVVGRRADALAVARGIALRTLGAGAGRALVLRTARPADWRWTRWWEPAGGLPVPGSDALVVVDGHDAQVGPWRLGAPDVRVLVLVPPGQDPPAWAPTVVRAPDDAPGVCDVVADAQSRAAAALAWVLAPDGAHALTADGLGSLPHVPAPDASAVASAWQRATAGRTLVVPLGTGPDGRPVAVDLVRDGPHVLVGGTTGAGKSELLTTLVLGAALTHPPGRLAVLLVDFKGGTGLGPVAGLPHVVDHVHDLDVTAAARTLRQLRAELRRREHVLAAAGATDVSDLGPEGPARLLVVVDELRALLDDLPDAGSTLARLAAQGRALGVHLVLATQRPAGAVPPDLRANLGLRIALRVADEDDSRDVVGTADAAHLDPAAPGSALLRVGAQDPRPLRVARARHRRPAPPVRPAPGAPCTAPRWCAPEPPTADVAAWVDACRDAARSLPGTGVPWVPALPDHVVAPDDPSDPVAPHVAVADVPDEQRRADVRWRTDLGPLLVLGGPRSGRTTSLTTVGAQVLRGGGHVHAVGLPPDAVARLRTLPGPGLGTTTALEDVHRTLLLLHRLATQEHERHHDTAPVTLLLDDLDGLLEALAGPARGRGLDLVETLLRRRGVHVAAAAAVVPQVTRLLGAFGTRLVLGLPDPALDLQAGVPRDAGGPRTVPGRAVACTREGTHVCQVVLPPGPAAHAAPAARPALRVGTLPRVSTPPPGGAARAPAAAPRVPLGTGGDGPGRVDVDGARPLVVAGPPGSGRSTALRTLAAGWARAGRRVVLVSADAPPVPSGRAGGACGAAVVPHDALGRLLDALVHPGRTTPQQAPEPHVLLVDDVDELERVDPLLADRLAVLVRRPPAPLRTAALATTTDHAAVAHRGPVAAALRAGLVLVLDPHGPAAGDLLGPDAALHVDPLVRPPGRGVLRDGRALVRVQVHAPDEPAARAA